MAVLKRLLVGISNPKDIIFFSAFFPQFVSISPHLDLSLTILTLTWIVLDFLTLSLVYIFSAASRTAIYTRRSSVYAVYYC